MRPKKGEHPVVLFDGVCSFCNSSVNFIIDHDPSALFRFAPLQSETGKGFLLQSGLMDKKIDSIVLIENGKAFTRSTAALRIARKLSFPFNLLALFQMIPPLVRDGVYDWIARNRYRWFGREKSCRIPTPEIRNRFLEID